MRLAGCLQRFLAHVGVQIQHRRAQDLRCQRHMPGLLHGWGVRVGTQNGYRNPRKLKKL